MKVLRFRSVIRYLGAMRRLKLVLDQGGVALIGAIIVCGVTLLIGALAGKRPAFVAASAAADPAGCNHVAVSRLGVEALATATPTATATATPTSTPTATATATPTSTPTATPTPTPTATPTSTPTATATATPTSTPTATATATPTATPAPCPPVAADDSYNATRGTTLNVPAPGVLANDTDAENDPLTAALVSPATKGTVTLHPDGSFSYLSTGYGGTTDSFTYRANDGGLNSNVATVTLHVAASCGAAACWRFDEPSGTTMHDSSPNANDGTYLGGVTLGVPGALAGDPDTAASFDGVNDVARVPDSSTLDVGSSFTLEGWVKRSSTAKSHELMNKGGNGLQLVVMNAGSGNQVWLRKANVTTVARSNLPVLADGGYHYVVATVNGANSAKIYVDGVQSTVAVAAAQVIQDTNFPLTLGATSSTQINFDEFAIYDGVLSAAEVQSHYQDATTP